jgi:hypothetical protein
MKITVFWDVTLCSLIENIYQITLHHFPEIYRPVLIE